VPVEPVQQLGAEHPALVHGVPETGEHLGDVGRRAGTARSFERAAEEIPGQETHVFGEEAEDAAHEEPGDAFGVEAPVLQRRGELGQLAGNLPGHCLGPPARIARRRLDEDVLEEPDVIGTLVQGGERNPAAGGKVAVGAGPAVPHDSGARHVHHHQIRRRRTRNMRDIIADLSKGLPEPEIIRGAAEILGLERHMPGLPVVNEVDRFPALAVHDPHRQLELVLRRGREWPVRTQRLEQVQHP
jgi:hypothetical protein